MLRTYNSYVFQSLVHIAIQLCTYMYFYLVYTIYISDNSQEVGLVCGSNQSNRHHDGKCFSALRLIRCTFEHVMLQ